MPRPRCPPPGGIAEARGEVDVGSREPHREDYDRAQLCTLVPRLPQSWKPGEAENQHGRQAEETAKRREERTDECLGSRCLDPEQPSLMPGLVSRVGEVAVTRLENPTKADVVIPGEKDDPGKGTHDERKRRTK